MLTDADWNEQSTISQNRLNDLAGTVIESGSPEQDGIVRVETIGGSESFSLVWGTVYVDGIPAEITPDSSVDPSSPSADLFQYTAQEDFPGAPPLPGGAFRLYLDVWERPVTAAEDSDLLDAGLHGADTCSRSRTMAQVKWCPVSIDPEDPAMNPKKGDCRLSLQLIAGTSEPDDCDPCSVEFDVNKTVGNYLFRVEIHDVEYHSGRPEKITLKWSEENGSEVYPAASVPAGFKAGGWVYEFFGGQESDWASEKYSGIHLNSFSPERGLLYSAWPETLPANRSMVRRWDGYVILEKQPDGTWVPETDGSKIKGVDRGIQLSSTSDIAAPAHITVGTDVTINLNRLFLKIELGDSSLLAGDYWLATVRQTTDEPGDWILEVAEPEGIEHHYMTIVTTSGPGFSWSSSPWDKKTLRKLRFPALTDMNAEKIGYTIPACDELPDGQAAVADLLDGIGSPGDTNPSVQDIIDRLLCGLNASTLPVLKDEDLCSDLLDPDVTSVQDALNRLCIHELSSCSTVTVHPHDDWLSDLDDIDSAESLSICFRNGTYNLDMPLVFENKKSIRITGAGKGTHIRCHSGEVALQFENCQEVVVENLYAECGKTGTGGRLSHLNGVINALNCGSVRVENSVALCAAGMTNDATCITVRNTKQRYGQATIRSCELNCGHYQTGLLLVNMNRSIVTDNIIRSRALPAGINFKAQLSNSSSFRNMVRQYLVNHAVIRKFQEDSGLDGRVVQLSVQGRRVEFRSEVNSFSTWENMVKAWISFANKEVRTNQELLQHVKAAADRMLTNQAFRSEYTPMDTWFKTMEKYFSPMIHQGIVIAGQKAGEVVIRNNSLSQVAEAFRVALSDSGDQKYIAGKLRIQDNNVTGIVPPFYFMNHQLVFVGHCNYSLFENNHIRALRKETNKMQKITGVKVRGRLGRMAIVRQNVITAFDNGIWFEPLDEETDTACHWIIEDNLTEYAGRPVVSYTEKARVNENIS